MRNENCFVCAILDSTLVECHIVLPEEMPLRIAVDGESLEIKIEDFEDIEHLPPRL